MRLQGHKGFVVLYFTVVLLAVVFGIAMAVTILAAGEHTRASSAVHSSQAYFAAEAGVEDAVYRIRKSLSYPASYTLAVAGASVQVSATPSGVDRSVVARATSRGASRALETTLTLVTTEAWFLYGVQVGEGGLVMGENSSVVGSVFSNGDIDGNGRDKSTVTGTAQAAGNHIIKDIRVTAGAAAERFDNCSIGGTASYVTSFTNCVASSTVVVAQAPPAQIFPISQAELEQWKAQAAAGGTLSGFTLGNNASGTLGPKKIEGNITLGNNATLTLAGTVWVTGTITFGNDDTIRLDSGYGTTSGVLLVDGAVDVGNSATFAGSGQAGSYLMLASLFGPGDAIDIGNNVSGAIFYAPNGVIDVGNNLVFREATGYGLRVGNNASITYETGLASVQFSAGPAGSFQLTSWREVE